MSTSHHVHVVRGAPDETELAALVAGLVARAHDEVPADDPAHAAWTDRRRTVRPVPPQVPSPHAWRWSLHP